MKKVVSSSISKNRNTEGEKTNAKINHIIFIIFMLITLIISIYHEPWRDEAQSYILSQLNIGDLLNQLKIEGHPILWYLILKIFHLPYQSIWILPWTISLISAAIIIYKNDKPIINKILLITSLPIIYVSTVFARSYCLVTLLIILLALVYKKRYDHPVIYGTLLALMINTHVIIIGFALSLVLIDIYNLIKVKNKRKSKVKAILIFTVGLLLLFLQLSDSVSARNDLFITDLIFHTNYLNIIINSMANFVGIPILGGVFAVFIVHLMIDLIKNRQFSLLIIIIMSYISFIGILTIYSGNYYMHAIILLIILFIYWQLDNKKRTNYIIGILFLSTLFNTSTMVINDIKTYYSTSKITSEYIKYNIDSKQKIYCLDTSICISLVPYIPQYKFIDINNNERFTYVDWIKNIYAFEDIKDYKLNDEQKQKVQYLLIPQSIKNIYTDDYNVIYESPPCQVESYRILKKKDG